VSVDPQLPRRRPRTALFACAALAALMMVLVVILATRDPAISRLAASPLVGKFAPDLVGQPLDGAEEYSLRERRGEYVLVNFFATWCVPCIEEHDDLQRFADAYGPGRIASVVSVVFSDDTEAVRRFFRERGGSWPVLADDGGAMATAWGVARVPESYLVAPDGTVLAKITGGVSDEFLRRQLDDLRSGGPAGGS
jgi:cytochrome c biogenesis protein CcmG, thiol:disulfide interchange protein DsbE